MSMIFPPDYPEILTELALLFYQRLLLLGVQPETRAADLAYALVEEVRGAWGCRSVYVPRGAACFRLQLDAVLWREFTGRNQAELARRHGVSRGRVYDGLNRERARRESECG